RPLRAMVVEDHGPRLVQTGTTGRQDPVPKLGILRTPGRSGAEAFIECAHAVEYGTAEGHVGAGADAPHLGAVAQRLREKAAIEAKRHVARAEAAHLELEEALCVSVEGRGHDQAGNRLDLG